MCVCGGGGGMGVWVCERRFTIARQVWRVGRTSRIFLTCHIPGSHVRHSESLVLVLSGGGGYSNEYSEYGVCVS